MDFQPILLSPFVLIISLKGMLFFIMIFSVLMHLIYVKLFDIWKKKVTYYLARSIIAPSPSCRIQYLVYWLSMMGFLVFAGVIYMKSDRVLKTKYLAQTRYFKYISGLTVERKPDKLTLSSRQFIIFHSFLQQIISIKKSFVNEVIYG